METRKAESKRSGEVRKIEHQNQTPKQSKERGVERKGVKKVCLGKCKKTEKIFTENETRQPSKIRHVAMIRAMPP